MMSVITVSIRFKPGAVTNAQAKFQHHLGRGQVPCDDILHRQASSKITGERNLTTIQIDKTVSERKCERGETLNLLEKSIVRTEKHQSKCNSQIQTFLCFVHGIFNFNRIHELGKLSINSNVKRAQERNILVQNGRSAAN